MAITGNALLVKKRQLLVVDDSEMHPRTAVGVDRDTKELICPRGRRAAATFSRGYTMVELGQMMLRLGAEDALNLDGGGSTTLAAVRDGHARRPQLTRPTACSGRSPNGSRSTYSPEAKRQAGRSQHRDAGHRREALRERRHDLARRDDERAVAPR